MVSSTENRTSKRGYGTSLSLYYKKKVINRLVGQTSGTCVQSVLAKWYCGCLTILLEIEMRNIGKKNKGEVNWASLCAQWM